MVTILLLGAIVSFYNYSRDKPLQKESKAVNGQQRCILVRMTQRSIGLRVAGLSIRMVHQE
jgi:hypothetical protein